MTVTIITESVIAHLRAGEICQSGAGSTGLTSPHYVMTGPGWTVESAPPALARLLLIDLGLYAGLTAVDKCEAAEEDSEWLPLARWGSSSGWPCY
jgi:hypothetical protein